MHARTTALTALALALTLAVTRTSHAGSPAQILLADGSILAGEVLEVQLNVRIRVQLDDGSVREIAWAELRAVPPVTPTPVPGSAPATGVVMLESTGHAMAITAPGAGTLCTTPCTVRLPLGPTQLYVGGYGRSGANVQLNVTEQPMRHVFFDAPRRTPGAIAPIVPLMVGLDLIHGALMGGSIAMLADGSPNGWRTMGAIAFGFSALFLGALIPLNTVVFAEFVVPRTGLARSAPLTQIAPAIAPVSTGNALTGATLGVRVAF